MCGEHATLDHTVFQGTAPVKVRLCDPCGDKVDIQKHLSLIKSASDHAAKTSAVEDLLKALGK
jgi:hypothetical protein